MPSNRSLAALASAIAIVALTGIAAGQSPGAGSELGLGVRIGISFGVALVFNLVLSGAAVAFGPQYTSNRVSEISDDPGSAFLWGLLVAIGVPIVLFLFAITIVGLIVAVPGFLLLAAVTLVGNAVTIVWVGNAIAGDSNDPGGRAVVVGAIVLSCLWAVPIVGNFLAQLLSLLGTGVVGRRLAESRQDD